jgi:hypothetical protein
MRIAATKLNLVGLLKISWGSSVSIVSGYRLDRAIEVRSPAEARDFSLASVQTGSGAHPVSCKMGTGGPLPRGKARSGHD